MYLTDVQRFCHIFVDGCTFNEWHGTGTNNEIPRTMSRQAGQLRQSEGKRGGSAGVLSQPRIAIVARAPAHQGNRNFSNRKKERQKATKPQKK